MSSRIFELDKQGVKALMKSEEMKQAMKSVADEAVGRLGEGYEADTHTGKTRVNASVYAVTPEARRENLSQNTILKAVFGK